MLTVLSRFLLVSLTMDAILAEVTIHRRRQALCRLSNGLGLQDAYDTTLDRIRQQGGSKKNLGMQTLMWISHSKRPLRSEELCYALGVELGVENFNVANVPSIRSVLGCTLGLVTIDEKASTLHLLHHTLQEYLRQQSTLFITPYSMMAEICLTYLNSFQPDDPGLVEAPFVEYATCFWGTYARRGVTAKVKSLSLRLLSAFENHVLSAIFWRKKILKWDSEGDVQGISGLHSIAFWGIPEIGTAMLEMKRWDVNRRDSRGDTPLMWAVEYGNNLMVQLFLGQQDIEPDMVIQHGRTALSFAAESGNEGIVKLLLERSDVNPNSSDKNGRTPLSFAVWSRNKGVVKLLLERGDVDPNLSENGGRTPLSLAVSKGHEGIVKLLLERGDVNPNSPDNNGRTPLSFAVWDKGLVKLLLEHRGVNPDLPDHHGRTLLSWFSGWGDEGGVKLLLERGDVNLDSLDRDGRTPLSYAAEWGRKGVAKMLLERRDINPDLADHDGRTPLSYAAEWGAGGVVQLLLRRQDVNPNSPDSNGRTPLAYAARRGREGVVKLFPGTQEYRSRLVG